jgi:RNase H-like domain found in reverse transcriptase/Integrase zinc binding domain
LLRGFIGSVGFLADDIPNIRLPLGILSAITGDKVSFRWTHTEQRAFEEVKNLTELARNHSRRPLVYGKDASQVWMVTDGCSTGVAGVVSQGEDWKTATVAAFYSAKLNNAQRNYPVHEIEMLAGIETMLRHKDVLQGVHFKWVTDHKGLIYLLNQKTLSGRQARWLEKISSFEFEVVYVAGSENVLADALSRIYSDDSPGTVRARSEFTSFDVMDEDPVETTSDMVMLAGINAVVATHRDSRLKKIPGAETGRPETSREFASRVKDKFVLRGPRERTEGESGSQLTTKQRTDPDHDQGDDHRSITDTPDLNPDVSLVSVLDNDAGINLLKELPNHYTNDSLFKTIMDKPKEFRNFEVKNNLIYIKLNGKNLLCIPKATIEGRNIHEIIISEAHSLLAHLGANKTVNYLRDNVWWKDLVSDTKAYCETCVTCKRSKPSNQKPYGLLNPLAVPSEPWESIGVDFVGPLPLSHNRDGEYDSITVVICLLTAMVEIIPSHTTYRAQDIAELMFENVYKHHGLPKTIISDRDVLFTSTFWKHLNSLIGVSLRMSSAYHPQTDGATERANRTITQMLRQCIDSKQKDWVSKLPTIQFAINSARSESTGYAPFFLNNGRMPRAMIWNAASPDEYSNVREFARKKKIALMSAHDSIIGSRVKQTRDANRKRQIVPFKNGDFVYLSTKNITFSKGLARKLIPKFIGPYKIIQDFNNQSFRIELPTHLKRRGIHDVFHSSLLKIHVPNDDRLFPGRMDTQIGGGTDAEDEWAVDKILSHAGSGDDSIFEILWKSGDVTWMPLYQIKHLQALETYLELMGVENASNLITGKGKPPHEDPQVFLGAITFGPPFPSASRPSLLPDSPSPTKHSLILPSLRFPDIKDDHIFLGSSILNLLFIIQPITLDHIHDSTTLFTIMTVNIRHPNFSRQSKTEYGMFNSVTKRRGVLHVGQIEKYLAFDRILSSGRPISQINNMPVGYLEFAEVFNNGAASYFKRDVSTIVKYRAPENPQQELEHIVRSSHPPSLYDFGITPEQCGLTVPRPDGITEAELYMYKDYAMSKAMGNKKKTESIHNRKEKRLALFDKPEPRARERQNLRYSPYSTASQSSTTEFIIDSFDGPPQTVTSSTSSQLSPEPSIASSTLPVQAATYYPTNAEAELVQIASDPQAVQVQGEQEALHYEQGTMQPDQESLRLEQESLRLEQEGLRLEQEISNLQAAQAVQMQE